MTIFWKEIIKEAKKPATKAVADESLFFQREQFEYQGEQDKKFEMILLKSFNKLRKLDIEERQSNQNFFLELDETFSGNNK